VKVPTYLVRFTTVSALALVAGACGGAGAELSSTSAKPGPRSVEAIAIETTAVVERQVAMTVRSSGTFVADESSDVTPQVSGSVVETPVSVGDRVRAGQLVVRLDDRNAQLELNHAQAMLQQVEAQAQNAKVEAARNKDLVASGDISKSAYEKIATQLLTADAAVAQARARVALAEKAVADTRIVAPLDGHISARPVAVGEWVNTSSKLVTIVRIRPIKLELQVQEAYAARLRTGMTVRAETPAFPGVVFAGTVAAKNPSLDPASRAMTVEVKFPNDDQRLSPGMFGTADIALSETEKALFVPQAAIAPIANGESSMVYVVDGTTARVRVVQLAGTEDGFTRVVAGLESGVVVATSALSQLFDGASVRTAAAAPSTPTASSN
jgi:RND family efflux transporter MFP subunit